MTFQHPAMHDRQKKKKTTQRQSLLWCPLQSEVSLKLSSESFYFFGVLTTFYDMLVPSIVNIHDPHVMVEYEIPLFTC